jgi:hypothetical protein
VHLLAPHFGNDRKAKKALVERLQDSAVLATAWWIATGYDVGAPYVPWGVETPGDSSSPLSPAELHDLTVESSKPDVSQSKAGPNRALTVSDGDILIGGQFWSQVTKEDQKQWDWASGLFKCSYPTCEGMARVGGKLGSKSMPIERMRMYALGVHFHRPDLLQMIRARAEGEVSKPEPSSKRGRKRSDDWSRWIAEVIFVLLDEKNIETLTANKLVERVEDRVASTSGSLLSKSTVHDAAQQALDLLRKKRASRS